MKQSVVGIVYHKGLFLLGLRKPEGIIGGLWEFIGGKCEQGESYSDALKREYEEELGITVLVGDFIARHVFTNEACALELFCYEVTIHSEMNFMCRCHTEFKWMSYSELIECALVPSDALFLSDIKKFYAL